MKMTTPPFGTPPSVRPVTVGRTASEAAPFTTWSPSVMTWAARPSVASLFAASSMSPEFRASAEAPTLIPFASTSAVTTV